MATTPWPATAWWKDYGDPQLDTLIAEALAGSPDLAVAEARLREIRAAREQAFAHLLPGLSGNATVADQRVSSNQSLPQFSPFIPKGFNDTGRASIDLDFEIDFWGKNRAALQAATHDVAASAADLAAAQLAIATNIATNYADLARLYADKDAAEAAIANRAATLNLIAARARDGLENLGAVRQAEAANAAAHADLAAIDEEIGLTRNRLAILAGAGPDRGLAITRPPVGVIVSRGLPARLDADLIGRRADIVANRLHVEAAAKRIHVAKSAFYPNVNLTALVGVQSFLLKSLFVSGSSIGSAGAAIHLPIFDGGQLRGQYRVAEAIYAQAVASYNGSLGQALKDIADVLVSQKALGERLQASRAAVSASSAAYDIARKRYEGGLAQYISVLTAEDQLINSRRALADLQTRAFTLDIALVRALGGGYGEEKVDTIQQQEPQHG